MCRFLRAWELLPWAAGALSVCPPGRQNDQRLMRGPSSLGREICSGSRIDHVTGSGWFNSQADCEVWVWTGVLGVGWARSPSSSHQGRHSQSGASGWLPVVESRPQTAPEL